MSTQTQPAPVLSKSLWSDLKTDEERANWLLLGRGYETGVIAKAIQNDVAMAFHYRAKMMAHDPHTETVRLLEEAERRIGYDAKPGESRRDPNCLKSRIRAHLAKLK